MTKLLEIKDKVIKFYSKNETYAKPVLKFLGCIVVYFVISNNIGYNSKVSSIPVILVLSLAGCLLPIGATTFLASVVILLNLYALSAEVAMIGAVIFLLILVIYYRFSSKAGIMALATPVLLKLNVPYIVPVGTALLKKPYAIIPSLCGTVVYFFLHGVKLSASTLSSDKVVEGEETAKYTVSVNQLVANKEMYLYLGIFIVQMVCSLAKLGVGARICELLLWPLMVLIFFRMFSKKLYKRQGENTKYLNWMWGMKNRSQGAKARHADKDHKYFTCKQCKTICRVPVGKGKIIITCPKCGAQIQAKT